MNRDKPQQTAVSPAFAEFCRDYADSELSAINPEDVRRFVIKLEQAVFCSMLHTFHQQGLLLDKAREYGFDEIISVSATAPKYRALIRRWLEQLTGQGWLKRREDKFFGAADVPEALPDRCWSEARAIWDGRLGSPLAMDYLISNARQLPALMRGERQAALLLFPEGKMDYANALYRESITARYLNKATAAAVSRICAEKIAAGGQAVRLVEIGAGTGATTAVVAPCLKACTGKLAVDYLFTDVSQFFLAAARQTFRDCPWMRFGLVNIDREFEQQGLAPESADIVIAAGVLNNAFNTDQTVKALLQLLPDGGWLLVAEPTREFPEMLISQAFMMTQPEDDRKNTKTTFLSVRQWEHVFWKAGAAEVLSLPSDEHMLAPMGQKFFAVKKDSRTRLTQEESL